MLLSGCSGYKPVPDKLRVGFPVWIGGPAMEWTFEKIE